MSLSRTEIIESLKNEITSWPDAVACWEGGSVANKKADQYSDLDLVICVVPGKINESFYRIEKLLKQLSGIDHQWRVPEPTWHGHGQCFYKLHNTPEYFFLDVVIMDENAQQRFFESERHGNPVIYFDKKSFIRSESADTPEFQNKQRQRLLTIRDSLPFFKTLVLKEVVRKRPLDAMAFYRSYTNLLIELYGLKYRPFRYDFGLRYLHNDLPQDIQHQLEKICYPADLTTLESNVPEIEKTVSGLMSELIQKFNIGK
jgi:predicted nucleotidyltransferase